MSNRESKNGNANAGGPAPGRAVKSNGWVQTERSSHATWGVLSRKKPTASSVMHHLTSLMDARGAVVISQKTLAEISGFCERAVRNAIRDLEEMSWIQVVQLGPGTTCAYVINDRVAWADKRSNLRLSMFSAVVVADIKDQDKKSIEGPALRKVPVIYSHERQLPAGDLEPPDQDMFDGMEPDLPAVNRDTNTLDMFERMHHDE